MAEDGCNPVSRLAAGDAGRFALRGGCGQTCASSLSMEMHTFSYSQHHFGKLTIDPTRTRGHGGALAPVIQAVASAEFWCLQQNNQDWRSILVQELSGKAVVNLAGGFALDMAPMPVSRVFAAGPAPHNFDLTFRVSQSQLEAIEVARKNGDIEITFQLQLTFQVLAKTGNQPTVGFHVPHVVVDAGVSSVTATIKVPQSTWAKEVLSQVGYGQVLLFEFPAFPVSALATLGEAFDAAKRAQQQFNTGEYDLSVGLCRNALQPLRNHLLKIKNQSKDGTAADWAEKVGAATFDWLMTVTGKTHGVSSTTHHEGTGGRFSRLDAHMILTTTVSVLAYAARIEVLLNGNNRAAP